MDRKLDAGFAADMLKTVAQAVIAETDRLTDADLAIGDGDHGIGMRRGFEAALSSLENAPPPTIKEAFKQVGMAIMSQTGGAAGAVFGTFFRSGASAFSDAHAMTAEGFTGFLEDACAAVAKRGGVEEGQKTMLDALAPAARSARHEAGNTIQAAVEAAAKAAHQGVTATKDMVATTGKARSLGERSLGHPDPGAISLSIILEAMKRSIVAA